MVVRHDHGHKLAFKNKTVRGRDLWSVCPSNCINTFCFKWEGMRSFSFSSHFKRRCDPIYGIESVLHSAVFLGYTICSRTNHKQFTLFHNTLFAHFSLDLSVLFYIFIVLILNKYILSVYLLSWIIWCLLICVNFLLILTQGSFSIDFWKEWEGEERETHQLVDFPHAPWLGPKIEPTTKVWALEQNQSWDPLVLGMTPYPMSQTD